MDKLKYKYIYKKLVKKESGEYEYYIVQVKNKQHSSGYLGCYRKYERAEKRLMEYAEENNLNHFDLLK